ncbi:hypothetical protein RV05_GL001400 [Enterococcus hirae]|nr:hypothetical protein RV05_GL001400 [Enterococcus hirae]
MTSFASFACVCSVAVSAVGDKVSANAIVGAIPAFPITPATANIVNSCFLRFAVNFFLLIFTPFFLLFLIITFSSIPLHQL